MGKILCLIFFHIFVNIPLKYSLYTRLRIIRKHLNRKVIHKIPFEGRGTFGIVGRNRYGIRICNKQICQNPQQMAKN